jgi:putative ATP-binding cassette transporter
LFQGHLLPPGRGRWRVALLLLPLAVFTAVAGSACLIGLFALLLQAALGASRFEGLFPYLRPALRLLLDGRHGLLVPAVALSGLVALRLAVQRLLPALRQRWLALTGLLALLVVTTAVDVAFTEGNGAVMDALNARSASGFWGTVLGLIAIYLLSVPLQYLYGTGQQRFALAWRTASNGALVAGWLQDRAYFRLESDPQRRQQLDNPDQRIADDIEHSVSTSTDLAFGFGASLLSLAAYGLVLLGLGAPLVLTLLLVSLLGNGVILRLVRRLAGLSSRQRALEADYRFALVHVRSHAEGLAFLRGERPVGQELGRRFRRLRCNLERLIRWRNGLDQATALYAFLMQFVPYLVLSGAYFAGRVSLGQLTIASLAFSQVQASLSFLIDRADAFASLFASLGRIGALGDALGVGLHTAAAALPAAQPPAQLQQPPVAPEALVHRPAEVQQQPVAQPPVALASGAAQAPEPAARPGPPQRGGAAVSSQPAAEATAPPPPDAASTPPGQAGPAPALQPRPQPATAAAAMPPAGPGASPQPAAEATAPPPLLRLHQLEVRPPGRPQPLLRRLDLELRPGERLLITGPSGCGKTSLLRVLGGLLAPGSGRLEWPDPPSLMVLPQRPYLPLGSLREQLLFPSGSHAGPVDSAAGGPISPPPLVGPSDDGALRALLAQVRLEELLSRYSDLAAEEDWERLLSGGEQQRLTFARLLLHRPDLAVLDEATSALDGPLEAHLYGLLLACGCALVSVGHRPSLRDYHQRELRCDGEGGWRLLPIG